MSAYTLHRIWHASHIAMAPAGARPKTGTRPLIARASADANGSASAYCVQLPKTMRISSRSMRELTLRDDILKARPFRNK